MSKELPSVDEELERARILGETARIGWRDLQRFFASGHAIFVAPELNLVDAAWHLSADNADEIASWMASGQLGKVTDKQAVEWFEANALMWAVVVRPWVVVQPILQPDTNEIGDGEQNG